MFDTAPDPDTPLLQDIAFAVALRLCGQNPVVLRSGLIVLRQRVFGVPMLMLPRATPPIDLVDQLRDFGLHRLPLILSPEHPCTLPAAVRLRAPQSMARLDLFADTQAARRALHPKWRNQLRRGEAAGLRVVHAPMNSSATQSVLTLETAQAKARRYGNWPAALTAAFAKVAPDQTRLFTAFIGNTAVAHMLFLRHGPRATYHIGHISARGKEVCAHNVLLWQASRWLADQGHTAIDLGLITPQTPGLNRFKLRTGAHLVESGGTWLRWCPLARKRAA
ncbi:MAG: GNAT family N-acetyltransferase [Sulfitobacter sp.]